MHLFLAAAVHASVLSCGSSCICSQLRQFMHLFPAAAVHASVLSCGSSCICSQLRQFMHLFIAARQSMHLHSTVLYCTPSCNSHSAILAAAVHASVPSCGSSCMCSQLRQFMHLFIGALRKFMHLFLAVEVHASVPSCGSSCICS